MYGHEKVVRLLLDHGADPKITDNQGRPLAQYAEQHPEVLKLLPGPSR
jgi:ankyrin repeat protein